jgi:hypothetical protein
LELSVSAICEGLYDAAKASPFSFIRMASRKAMAVNPIESYPLALLKLMGKQADAQTCPPLGMAKCLGVENLILRMAAHKLLEAVIEHSPHPAMIAREFLAQLGKCGISVVEESAKSSSFSFDVFSSRKFEWLRHYQSRRLGGNRAS